MHRREAFASIIVAWKANQLGGIGLGEHGFGNGISEDRALNMQGKKEPLDTRKEGRPRAGCIPAPDGTRVCARTATEGDVLA